MLGQSIVHLSRMIDRVFSLGVGDGVPHIKCYHLEAS